MKEVAIIGGGILGLSIGYKLSQLKSNYRVFIFEKEQDIGLHQSGRNSGVLHCGLHYNPGSLKAKLAVNGIREMQSFCSKNEVEYDICGKIVVASDEREVKLLDNLASRGKKNGLKNLQYLDKNQLKKREPNVKALKTLFVPEEGIVSFTNVMKKLSQNIQENNGKIYLNSKVISSKEKNDKVIVITDKIEKEFDLVINCGGLFSDKIFKKITKSKSPLKIIPFRGEYMKFNEDYKNIFNHLIYPVPDPKFPFLGVHFTRMINNDKEVGPNAVLALKREGYKNTDISVQDFIETITYKGFLNFLYNNFYFNINEFLSSMSTTSFVKKAKKLIPDVEEYMFSKKKFSGVRAQAIDFNGELVMDFKVIRNNNQVHVLNAPSPGATASLAIAEHIIENYIK